MALDYRAVSGARRRRRARHPAARSASTTATTSTSSPPRAGRAALELLAEHDVAVIVADQRMPQMSGTEFLERSMDVRPDAMRIILTGYTDVDALVQAVNLSRIYRYVTKPWESEELRLTLLARDRGVPPHARERAPGRGAAPGQRAPRGRERVPARVGDPADGDRRRERARSTACSSWSARVAPTATHRADRGRDRHRQGAGGARHPRGQPAPRRAVRGGQLRGAVRGRPRERAVRPPARRVHRRGRRPQGALRGGRRRHALPRRDRRETTPALQAKLLRVAAGGRDPARRRQPLRSRSTSASSPPPTATSTRRSRRAASARTCSTGCTSSRSTCRRCASAARTSRCWRATWCTGWRRS